MKKICIIGTGGFAKEVYWLISDLGREAEVACFMEPDEVWKERNILEVPVWPQSEFDPSKHTATIAIGHPAIREKVTHQLPPETEYETLIHPTAIVPKWSKIGEGSIMCAYSVITVDVVIGRHAHMNVYTGIGHDTIIGDFMTTTAHVVISGDCQIGDRVFWGHGSCIRQGMTVCEDVTIGMGAVVAKDITEPGVYVGIPAKKLEKK